jgi:hypothetical protein
LEVGCINEYFCLRLQVDIPCIVTNKQEFLWTVNEDGYSSYSSGSGTTDDPHVLHVCTEFEDTSSFFQVNASQHCGTG